AMDMVTDAAPGAGLADRIIRAARRRRLTRRVARVLAPLAAAAAVVAAVYLISLEPQAPAPTGVAGVIDRTLQDVPQNDRFLVQNLPMFQNYDEVVSFEQVRALVDEETLSALDELEGEGSL
ncbi:hypothetical protein LCGC14_3080160, partial [marine sediment metagenome]